MDYYDMEDTTLDMVDYQYRLVMKMTPQQRFKMGLEMADEGMKLMRAGILSDKGKLSEYELRNEVIRRLRKYDSSLFWLDDRETFPGPACRQAGPSKGRD
ncbi:MAG: hypothetical protein JXR41_04465 [Bacteroidales bacterium]|nr:hypothetical protein [Bacteroidales bacterium]MBN2762323.1 hypothetical protein [Bacteroidales bacterium]